MGSCRVEIATVQRGEGRVYAAQRASLRGWGQRQHDCVAGSAYEGEGADWWRVAVDRPLRLEASAAANRQDAAVGKEKEATGRKIIGLSSRRRWLFLIKYIRLLI